jgi:subtilisin family serine protease
MRISRALVARLVIVTALTASVVLATSSASSARADRSDRSDRTARAAAIEHPYIVVLRSTATPRTVADRHADRYGAHVNGVWSHALDGYAATMTAAEAARLKTDPSVALVQPDVMLHINPQTIPTGIRRIFATNNPNLDIDGLDDARIDVDVAVIDSGTMSHPDLNVVSRANCSTGACVTGTGNDDNGHGTHVGGTIGAIDNADGVVGVAPGARLHSVKVCNAAGQCPNSAIVAGVDYVTARASTIEVANMSLGGPGTNTALAQAITRSVNAGVVYAVAAGNNAQNAAGFSPANHPDVITVSALADSNGIPGGGGGALPCRPTSQDDVLADFSNFGTTVEVAAPGVCILSTWNNGGYNTISGTSMASPHVAGAAAVLASGTRDPLNRTDVLAIRQRIVSTGNLNWTDNSGDGVKEPLLDVHDATQFPPGGGGPGPAPVTVFADDFESAAGAWTTNPSGTDTATTGAWQRGDPAATSSGVALQLGTTTSGANDLVTGATAGAAVGDNDVDGGTTSVRSGVIALPATGTLTLSTQWYLAHLSNATSADFFRISVVSGTTTTQVFQQLGAAANRAGAWGTATANLTPFAGQSVQILIQTADAGTASLVEAGVDDLRITQQT